MNQQINQPQNVAVPTIYMIDFEQAKEYAPIDFIKLMCKEYNGYFVIDFAKEIQVSANYPQLIYFLQSIAQSGYRYVYFYDEVKQEKIQENATNN